MAHYVPPKQGKVGQIIDVIVLLVLAIGSLYIPLFMGMAGSTKTPQAVDNPTWESLGQNATMVQRWNELGYADPAAAADIITARFDYTFSWASLALMVVILVSYFAMMLILSEKEYREMISEKFGKGGRG